MGTAVLWQDIGATSAPAVLDPPVMWHKARGASQQKQHLYRAVPRSASMLLTALLTALLLLESRGTVMLHRVSPCEVQSTVSDS